PGISSRIIPPSPPPCGTVPRRTPDTSAAPPAKGIRPVPRTARPGKPSRRTIGTDNSLSGHPNASAAIPLAGNPAAGCLSPLPTPLPFGPDSSPRARPQEPFSDSIHAEAGHLVPISVHSLSYVADGRAGLPHPRHNRDLRSLAPNKVNIFQRDIYLQAAFHLCPSGGLKGGGHHRPPARFSSNRRRIRFSSSMISAFSLGSSSGSWSSPRASRSICSRIAFGRSSHPSSFRPRLFPILPRPFLIPSFLARRDRMTVSQYPKLFMPSRECFG